MFGLLNTSQIYGLQQPAAGERSTKTTSSHNSHRSTSSRSSNNKLLATFNPIQGMKSPTNFIEKFIKSELLTGYDAVKNFKNFHHSSKSHQHHHHQQQQQQQQQKHQPMVFGNSNLGDFHGNYQSDSLEEDQRSLISEKPSVTEIQADTIDYTTMTVRCSTNVIPAEHPQQQQHSYKIGETNGKDRVAYQPQAQHFLLEADITPLPSSGASSGEFNEPTLSEVKISNTKVLNELDFVNGNANEITSDHSSSSSSSSLSTTTTTTKSNEFQRSSGSSPADSPETARRKKATSSTTTTNTTTSGSNSSTNASPLPMTAQIPLSSTPERSQRRKFIQMISFLDQQNQRLQRELTKEKRRRTEELSCIVKSLICFESKLKIDKNQINQRLLEKDNEICRLVRQNRALRKKLEVGVETGTTTKTDEEIVPSDLEDCLVLEALQCINCKTQFYDIETKLNWTQTGKDGSRTNDDHTTEHGSSSDDTVSSSFYGARRSVRYTSKRTFGTFRDYMRSRSMNIDDPNLDNSEENASTISRDDSQNSYEKMNIYSRTIERMHGVRRISSVEGDALYSEYDNNNIKRRGGDGGRSTVKEATQVIGAVDDDDDGIFSPAQDEELDEEDGDIFRMTKSTMRKEFSEASPKQEFEMSTDDWYASASDQEEAQNVPTKSYGYNAVNPVLECVNQILLQQSMEESMTDGPTSLEGGGGSASSDSGTTTALKTTAVSGGSISSIPRQSSLSGRRSARSNSRASNSSIKEGGQTGTISRKRVHFSTKNSMVHVPRNDDVDDDDDEGMISSSSPLPPHQYHSMEFVQHQQPTSSVIAEQIRDNILNYESIYSNEYEPIGSEHNSSNLYVDMESPMKMSGGIASDAPSTRRQSPTSRYPPALPPKPANLIRFKKKSLSHQQTPIMHQLDEMPDDELTAQDDDCTTEPDYCSISEVNMAITSVQIVADVHKAPESESHHSDQEENEHQNRLDLELVTAAVAVKSGDTRPESLKTDEIEEIFADIPKLPNVAAIIAPKSPRYSQQHQSLPTDNYLLMSPKTEAMSLGSLSAKRQQTTLLQCSPRQFKRKHVPNILSEINKRMAANTNVIPTTTTTTPTKLAQYLPSNSTTPKTKTTPTSIMKTMIAPPMTTSSLHLQQLHQHDDKQHTSMTSLHSEFDWYNLDAEYGRASSSNQPDILKVTGDSLASGGVVLEEINEFLDEEDELCHEINTSMADEYNLDEEFSLANQPDVVEVVHKELNAAVVVVVEDSPKIAEADAASTNAGGQILAIASVAVCEQSLPLLTTNESTIDTASLTVKKFKTIENFEKFIDKAGLSTKPLPRQRKIYFSAPFV